MWETTFEGVGTSKRPDELASLGATMTARVLRDQRRYFRGVGTTCQELEPW